MNTEATLDLTSALLLGLLQGVTEFLPVSSSGHLALAQHLGFGGAEGAPGAVAFDILLHLATVLVVLKAFWSDIRRVLRTDRVVLFYIVMATIPAGVVGVLFRDSIVDSLRASPQAVCAALLVTAGALYLCDRMPPGLLRMKGLDGRGVMAIGLAQALALVPGISRSGLTITGGVVSGLTRDEAVRFSFLLMVPAVLGAAVLDLVRNGPQWRALPVGPAAAGFLAALVSGYVCLRLLHLLVIRQRLRPFMIYCLVIGGGGLLWFSLS